MTDAPTIATVFRRPDAVKRPAPGVRSLDLDLAAELMVQALNHCAADWRDDVLGDAVAQLRRRHRELSDRDIESLVTAIRARVERWQFRPPGHGRMMPIKTSITVEADEASSRAPCRVPKISSGLKGARTASMSFRLPTSGLRRLPAAIWLKFVDGIDQGRAVTDRVRDAADKAASCVSRSR